ncbi:MAG: histone deacetylase [Saprospiraceae bacterium]|nr:histone deacetylase [Saprospiraceae bacterium]
MIKYELLPEQLLYEGTATRENFFQPDRLEEEIILLTHEQDYWDRLKHQRLSEKEIRAIGFPMSERLIERGRHIAQGTIQCALFARQDGVSLNTAGGTHHSFSYKGEGFCILNDIAIAANYLLHEKLAGKILIIDLDVHQGNGTAQIFQNEKRVFTFSMHGEKNYPLHKVESDLDIGMPDETGDRQYLDTLRQTLPDLLQSVQPDIAFYLSGVDPLKTDKLGRLSMSIRGLKSRDRFVFESLQERNIPVAVSMGGGYSERIAHIIEAHANTYRVAREIFF